jgi:hypothetical protein
VTPEGSPAGSRRCYPSPERAALRPLAFRLRRRGVASSPGKSNVRRIDSFIPGSDDLGHGTEDVDEHQEAAYDQQERHRFVEEPEDDQSEHSRLAYLIREV